MILKEEYTRNVVEVKQIRQVDVCEGRNRRERLSAVMHHKWAVELEEKEKFWSELEVCC